MTRVDLRSDPQNKPSDAARTVFETPRRKLRRWTRERKRGSWIFSASPSKRAHTAERYFPRRIIHTARICIHRPPNLLCVYTTDKGSECRRLPRNHQHKITWCWFCESTASLNLLHSSPDAPVFVPVSFHFSIIRRFLLGVEKQLKSKRISLLLAHEGKRFYFRDLCFVGDNSISYTTATFIYAYASTACVCCRKWIGNDVSVLPAYMNSYRRDLRCASAPGRIPLPKWLPPKVNNPYWTRVCFLTLILLYLFELKMDSERGGKKEVLIIEVFKRSGFPVRNEPVDGSQSVTTGSSPSPPVRIYDWCTKLLAAKNQKWRRWKWFTIYIYSMGMGRTRWMDIWFTRQQVIKKSSKDLFRK